MNFAQTMKALEAAGSEQTRKTYARHGIQEPQFGVSFAELKKLKKQLKVNSELAQELWQSGNHDARVLATLIVDTGTLRPELVEAWAASLDHHTLTALLAGVISRSPLARDYVKQWIPSASEYLAQAGWNILTELALHDKTLDESYFAPYLQQIQTELQQAPNHTRYAMNNTLIAIGVRTAALEAQALEVARCIGKVEVDHGDTACKTPEAIPYIRKTLAKKGHVVPA